MADYKEIHGVNVQYRDADATAIEGDVWYNASTGLLKMYASVNAWSSGGNLNTARYQHGGFGSGTTAALIISGATDPITDDVESYDGSSWTETAEINTEGAAGIGVGHNSNTAGLYVTRQTDPANLSVNESWNGSTWTEIANSNSTRAYGSGSGTQTAGIIAGGRTNPSSPTVNAETWNGTSWTEVANLNTARIALAGLGTTTAALMVGGLPSPGNPVQDINESWDGSSWTELADINTARRNMGGAGTTTAAFVFGGYSGTATLAVAESWDGSSWTEEADLATSRQGLASGAVGQSSLNTLAYGGYTATAITNVTEEWAASASVETVAFD